MNPHTPGDLYKPASAEPSSNLPSGQPNDSTAETQQAPASPSGSGVSWTASEYTHHERGASWYLSLTIGSVVLAAAVYLLTKDYFAVGTIIALGIIVGVFAGRKPDQLNYELTDTGLRIGDKRYAYGLFKSFAVIRQGALGSINLMPVKRFMPPVSANFAPSDEVKIIDLLGQHLPYEERKADSIDRLSHRLRF